jgi:hypothetical protein
MYVQSLGDFHSWYLLATSNHRGAAIKRKVTVASFGRRRGEVGASFIYNQTRKDGHAGGVLALGYQLNEWAFTVS